MGAMYYGDFPLFRVGILRWIERQACIKKQKTNPSNGITDIWEGGKHGESEGGGGKYSPLIRERGISLYK